MQLLKFITCGSVDDGKSTLIGHILYDSKLLYADQEKALELDSKVGSREGAIDYSLLLDGLMAEREQGITIDVAYRYFTTDARSFIVADTPGHEEYTRNMAVGASFADLAVILVDAKHGVLVQTKRHARICSLMGIKYFVFAVNKMDLVGYSESRFQEIATQIQILKEELNLENTVIIPVSATEGDNVTKRSENIHWYEGPVLLQYLEQVDIKESNKEVDFYMPVQRVCRPNHSFRGFQGQVEAGEIHTGDEIVTLPSNEKAKVKSLHILNQQVDEIHAGQPATIQLDREVDVSRGCVITKSSDIRTTSQVEASILWMDDVALEKGKNFFVKLGTKLIPGVIKNIKYAIDVNTGTKRIVETLSKNEIAVCEISFADSIVVDLFEKHKTLGELILIDRISNMTSACGVVTALLDDLETTGSTGIDREARSNFKNQRAVAVEFKAGAGVTYEFVQKVEKELALRGRHTYLYTPEKEEKAEIVVKHLLAAGVIVLVYTETGNVEALNENKSYITNWIGQEQNTVAKAVEQVYRFSAIHSESVENGAYI